MTLFNNENFHLCLSKCTFILLTAGKLNGKREEENVRLSDYLTRRNVEKKFHFCLIYFIINCDASSTGKPCVISVELTFVK